MKFATKLVQHYPPHLRNLATLPWETKKIQILCRYSADMEENTNKLYCECTGRLPIVRWSDREHLFLSLKNTKSVADCGKFWSRSLARIMRAAQFASVSCYARRLLKHFRRKSLHIIRNTDVSSNISLTVLWVCSLSSGLETKSLTVSTFSSVRALRGLLLTGRLSTVPASRNFFNTMLTRRFVQLFSGNLSVNLFAVYPLKCKLLYQNPVLVAEYHVDCWQALQWHLSDVTNFRCHKLIANINDKEQWYGKFYLQSVWGIIKIVDE